MATNLSKLSINCSPEKLWEVVTLPAFVKLWQYGSELKTTWEVGSPIKFVTEWDKQVFEQWGTVLEFDPPRKLRYSLFAAGPGREDRPENYFEMSYILTPGNGHTMLEIVQVDNRPNAVQEAEQGEENPVLKMLKEVAEQD